MNKKLQAFLSLSILVIVAGLVGFWIGGSHEKMPSRIALAAVPETLSTEHRAEYMDSDFYNDFFRAAPPATPSTQKIISAVIPHHLLAGRYLASFFNTISNASPSVVVLLGPNHPQAGRNTIVTGLEDWRTPYGTLPINQNIISALVSTKLVTVDDSLIGSEHTISADVPFIKKTWPSATLVPLIIKESASNEQITNVAQTLKNILPADAVVIASVDFSHYLPERVANFHDELSENVLATSDVARVNQLEVDSQPSLRLLLLYNALSGATKFHKVFHTNSATLSGSPDIAKTTSHLLGYFTNGNPAEPIVSLQFFGDIMLDRDVGVVMGKEGLDGVLKNIRGDENRFFSGTDGCIANLEGPFAPTRVNTAKQIAFRFDPAYASEFKKYHFLGFNIANNHAYDMGEANAMFTRDLLKKNNLVPFGDEMSVGQNSLAVIGPEHNLPFPVALVGFNASEHPIDLVKAAEVMAEAQRQATYVVVNVHWGEEYKIMSNQAERDFGHWFIDHGATAVIGHHPHVVQEIELYKGAPIFYSLGNFIFDQYFSPITQEGLSVGLTFGAGKVQSVYLFPFFSKKSVPELMNGEQRDRFLNQLQATSRLDGKQIIDGKLTL